MKKAILLTAEYDPKPIPAVEESLGNLYLTVGIYQIPEVPTELDNLGRLLEIARQGGANSDSCENEMRNQLYSRRLLWLTSIEDDKTVTQVASSLAEKVGRCVKGVIYDNEDARKIEESYAQVHADLVLLNSLITRIKTGSF